MALLEVRDLRTSFFTDAGEVRAVNGVSFNLERGKVLGIVGESGSGKSVTAYSLMGLTAHPGKLLGGTLEFNGHHIETMTEKEMCKISFPSSRKRVKYSRYSVTFIWEVWVSSPKSILL